MLPRPLLVPSLVAMVAMVAGCTPAVATTEECDKVASHLADLKVAREKLPASMANGQAHRGILVPPFDDEAHVKEVRDEALGAFKDRCTKGWKRAAYECMLAAKDLDEADTCRLKNQ